MGSVAKRKMPVGRPFKKGECANPYGAAGKDPAMRAIRKMSREQVAEFGTMLLTTPMSELRKMAEDESQFGITHFLLKQMMNASKGSGAAFDRLFDRIVGKVQDDVKITAGVDIKVSSDQLASMAQAALKRTKGGNE